MNDNLINESKDYASIDLSSRVWKKLVIIARGGAGIMTIGYSSYESACNARSTFKRYVKRMKVKGIRTRIVQDGENIKLRISRKYREDYYG